MLRASLRARPVVLAVALLAFAGAIWMGNFSGETVIEAPGSSLPATALRRVFDANASGEELPKLMGVQRRTVCAISGMGATDLCGATVTELFPSGQTPEPCDWHRRSNTGVALYYPQKYQLWAEEYGYRLRFQQEAELAILSPVEGALFYHDPSLPASAQQLRLFLTGSGEGELLLNGESLYRGKLPVSLFWSLVPGRHYFELVRGEERVVRTILVR